ncbi:MAG TPA: ShlB/FhaC/HecB family hemolysin secretion/activation protein [Gemmataceae bacterium]|jgi:hemolysin activation/secretion protein|nr:ShlB/FhaC/HecB family hemolysin secretion/activation protein [Gemmataceae bacterium]
MTPRRLLERAGLAAFLVLTPALALAVELPGSADPGRVLQDRTAPEEPGAFAPPRIEAKPEKPKKSETGIFMNLRRVQIEGMTAYPAEEFRSLYEDKIGMRIDQGEIAFIASEIEAKYHADGYVFAKATSAIDPSGSAVIRVNEGRIGNVSLEGSLAGSELLIRMAAQIRHGSAVNIRVIERVVLLMNDLPGVTAKSVLKPAGGDALDVVIVAGPKPADSSLSLDNYGSRYNGPFEIAGSTSVNNLGIPFGQTSFGVLSTLPPDELRSVQVGESIPVDANGTTGSLQIAHVESRPGYLLKDKEIVSISYSAQLQFSHPLIRSRAENLFVTAGFTARDTATDVLETRLTKDRLRILSLSALYDFQDSLAGRNQLDAQFSQGIGIMGGSAKGDSDLSRADADPEGSYFHLSATRMQTVTDTVGIYASVESQFATAKLLSAEQFGYGGQKFGRAYDPSEFTADNGVEGLIEVTYSGIPDLGSATMQPFASADFGRLWNEDAEDEATTAASIAIGLRFAAQGGLSGQFMTAAPFLRPASAPGYGSGYAPRCFLSLSYRF